MKSIFKRLLFSSLVGASLTPAMSFAAGVDTENGDLFVAFYQIGEGDVVGDNTYIFNLGPAATFRENTLNNALVSSINPSIADSNIAADLEAAFGSTWAEDGTVFWCLVGGLNQTTVGFVGGERQQSSYASRAVTDFVAVGPTTVRLDMAGGTRNTFRNNVEAYQVGNDGVGTTGTNPRGAIVPTSLTSTAEDFLPPLAAFGQFGTGLELRQSFGVGLVNGSANLEGALDLWRLPGGSSTSELLSSGTDLTSGLGQPVTTLGQGQYIGTLTLDSDGNLRIGGTASSVAGSFSTWATQNNVTGGANGDSDNDGIRNLVEYALNLNPAASDGAPGTFAGGLLSFSKRAEAVTNNDVVYSIQESDDLGITDAWQSVAPTSNTPTAITYQIPSGSAKKFTRLQIATTP